MLCNVPVCHAFSRCINESIWHVECYSCKDLSYTNSGESVQGHKTMRHTWPPDVRCSGGVCMDPKHMSTCMGCCGRRLRCWWHVSTLAHWYHSLPVHVWHVCGCQTACKWRHAVRQCRRMWMPRASRYGAHVCFHNFQVALSSPDIPRGLLH